MKNYRQLLGCIIFCVFIASCGPADHKADPVLENGTISFELYRFQLKDVKLLEGPFKHANELNEKVLLKYEPDRFLATFRKESGLEPRAERYGGWESSSIAGHSLGHYLSACAMMSQSTDNPEFLRRVNYIVDELEQVQEAYGDGYIGAFPDGKKVFEEEIAKGVINASAFDLNGIWAPWYTHHKVLAGLRDAYYLCKNEKALQLAIRFAGWMETIVGHLPDETIQEMLICEYGGMNEVLAELYFLTGDEKYLTLSRVFHDKRILDSLAMGIDVLPGKHANTQIPKIIGLARCYELTGNRTDKETARFFWHTVVHDHSYVTGSNALAEHFGPAGKLNNRLGANTGETCNVYNMLKLTDHLFRWDPSPELADYYERALFNHILASQHPENGRVTYHLSLEMGGFKYFQDPFAFTCCIGTGMENHAKYGENIYYHNDSELYVSQYIASELNWSDKGLVLRQETGYPEQQGTRLVFACHEPVELTLKLRYPSWAEKGMEITVNGEEVPVDSDPGSFVAISRTWQQDDTVDVSIPFTLRLESMPDNEDRVALFYGPLTLAGDLGPVNDPAAWDLVYVPLMVNAGRNAEQWTEPVRDRNNVFVTREVGKPRDVQLIPFYAIYDRRYSVYWDLANEETWNEREARHQAMVREQKILESRTVDYFQPGNISHERSHLFEGPGSTAHRFRNKTYRVTLPNEWFAFNIKVRPDRRNALNIEYWGGGYDRESAFDIVVDGTRIASEDITDPVGDGFYTREYGIPLHLTRNKNEIRVEIRSQARRLAGPIYGIRTVID
ncbi:MAG: glycoside hydrolase family 127 protein [Bacteroidales bacterium]